jgi:hypothetical protein
MRPPRLPWRWQCESGPVRPKKPGVVADPGFLTPSWPRSAMTSVLIGRASCARSPRYACAARSA